MAEVDSGSEGERGKKRGSESEFGVWLFIISPVDAIVTAATDYLGRPMPASQFK